MYILSLSYPHFPFLKNSSTLTVSVTHRMYPHPNPRNKSKLFNNELPVEHWTLEHWQCQLPIACPHPKTRNKFKLFKNELPVEQTKWKRETAQLWDQCMEKQGQVQLLPAPDIGDGGFPGFCLHLDSCHLRLRTTIGSININRWNCVLSSKISILRSLTPRYPLWRCWSWSVHEVSNMLLCVTKITMWVENCVTMWIVQ